MFIDTATFNVLVINRQLSSSLDTRKVEVSIPNPSQKDCTSHPTQEQQMYAFLIPHLVPYFPFSQEQFQ